MRTTIDLDDDLLIQAKEIAARSRRSVSDVVSDAVREAFLRHRQARKRVQLPTFGGAPGSGWLRPGWDLDHMADFMEKLEAAEREQSERERQDHPPEADDASP